MADEEVALVRSEEERKEGVFSRSRESPQRHVAVEEFAEGVGRDELGRKVGRVLDPVLGDQIDLHVVSRGLGARVADVADLSRARRGIGRHAFERLQPRRASEHDDLPRASLDHLRQHRAGQPMQRMHHGLEHVEPDRVVEVRHPDAQMRGRGQVRDEHVDPTGLGDELRGSVGGSGIARIGDHLGAVLAKQGDGGRSHVALGASHQHPLPCQASIGHRAVQSFLTRRPRPASWWRSGRPGPARTRPAPRRRVR